MNEIVHRIIAQVLLVFLPLGMMVPFLESIKNEKVTVIIAVIFIAWYIYLRMWSKVAAQLYNSDSLYLLDAWRQSRPMVNNDIIVKLSFLPIIGGLFDNWINRNNPDHEDDREIKISSEEK